MRACWAVLCAAARYARGMTLEVLGSHGDAVFTDAIPVHVWLEADEAYNIGAAPSALLLLGFK